MKSFVGRERELTELESGLEEASAGAGGLFLLVGEPGVGKTRLADELVRRAKERGFSVHWGRCWEVGGAPAYWPWIQVFRSLLREPRCKALASAYGDVLSRLLPELRAEGEAPAALQFEQAQARFQLFDELWAMQRAVAESVPLLLVLDDLHAADPSSLALLQFVVRDLRTNRVMVAVTYRDRDAKPLAEVAETIRAITRDGTFLPVRRLDLDEVEQFLKARAGRAVSSELVRAMHTATEGNPLFVDQVFRVLEARAALDAPGASLPIPEGLRDMIQSRVASLSAPARELLDAAAVIGREFSRDLLASVAQRTEIELRAPLAEVLASGILSEPSLGLYEFSHALFREALYRDLSAQSRAELHARAGLALEGTNAPQKAMAEIASHLLGAVSVVGPERALTGAMHAGRRALAALAFEDAETILSTTLEQVSVGPSAQKLKGQALVLLGEARARAGHHDAARKACEEAAAIARKGDDPTLLAEAALALGVEILPGVIPTALVALLVEARAALPDTATRLRARVLARLAAALQPADNPEEPIELARAALSLARTLNDDVTLRECLHMGGSALVDYAEPAERLSWDGELLRLSIEAGDVIACLRAHVRLVFDYLESGQPESADAQIVAHGKLADELGLPRHQWLTLMLRALRAGSEGRFEECDVLVEQARRVGQRVITQEMTLATHLHAWGMALSKGEPLPYIAEIAEATAHMPGTILMMLVVRACEHARRGELEPARSALNRIAPDSVELTRPGPHLRFVAEACTRLGDSARAEPVYRALLPYASRLVTFGRVGLTLEGPHHWLLGMLASTMQRFGDAERHFEAALEQTRALRMLPAEAIVCLEYARSLVAQGQTGGERYRTLVERGTTLCERIGAPRIAAELAALASGSSAGAPAATRAAAKAPATPAPDLALAPNVSLTRDGELWLCTAQGRSFRLKDSRGVQMLAELVLHPNREFHVLTLMGSETSEADDAGEHLDREAIHAYREHVEDLREQIAEAESFGDTARASALNEKLELVAAELARGVGLGGRSRRAGAAAERARVNVQRRLRDAIKRVAEQDAALGRHLDRAVRTGTFCAYEPN
ncbi:MAG TPA: AAA family ATPase [Polyangiaceae bacterium]|nr:AAA family ATPase [Polyangiaceae bacterium]